jgi:hypothetical protein
LLLCKAFQLLEGFFAFYQAVLQDKCMPSDSDYIPNNFPYFFVLIQKSSKKNQGCRKMTKNCSTGLNAANSPSQARGQTALLFPQAGRPVFTIFLTPFF